MWHVSARTSSTQEFGRPPAGWRAALTAAGLDLWDPLRSRLGARSGYDAGLRLCQEQSMSAVFVANDHMALGVLRALAE